METSMLAGRVVRSLARMQVESPSVRLSHGDLVLRILPRLRRYFGRVVGQQEAEDCLQETLVLIEQSLTKGTYDPSRSFNTWIWLKARTVYAQWCRRCARDRMGPLDVDPTKSSDRLTKLAAKELLDQVAARLGAETHEMFVLYYEGQLTQEEVAEVTGRDPKTVRKRLREAHALLDRLQRSS